MKTWRHYSHQSALLAQSFAAALAMLGMGLEGMATEQQADFLSQTPKSND
ncbi:MAG: hypothetical protein PHH47_09675 [Gallionella sp.]|nr:hypothetical protein [Gallionella sp.]MDD4946654.1 hypothetical protein [Gallionella sp.]MDD5611919.1 hypothetical protein [Gallionella sp.]